MKTLLWLAWTLAAGSAQASSLELSHTLRALDALGQPIEGETPVTITLYRDAEGTQTLWTRDYTPDFSDGYATVILADGTPALGTSLFAGGDVYLGLSVDEGAELVPRQRLLRVPSAGVADAVPTSASPGATCDSAGQLVYDTTAAELRVCNGASWDPVGTRPAVYANGTVTIGNTAYTTQIGSITESTLGDVATLSSSGAFTYTALEQHTVTIHVGGNSTKTADNSTLRVELYLQRDGQSRRTVTKAAAGGYNGDNEMIVSFSTVLFPGDVITSGGYNYRSGASTGYFSVVAQP